ncbi:protease inhibitor I42 family protein [Anaerosinus massiliensis]|uniref:protease inhibitor I42 family protein n=1 Tax=Massilibacillus massiliensis TaxID=1806837 RepID=UPI000DA5EE35|nr:protease inhibitor I42 family protein [Massilibacillus massiliensis]
MMKQILVRVFLMIGMLGNMSIAFMQPNLDVDLSVEVNHKGKQEKLPEEFILTKQDYNRVLQVQKNDMIQIRLAENPSTGYTWKFRQLNTECFEVLNVESFIPDRLIPMVGQSGLKVITLKARKIGTSVIEVVNYRDWEGENKAIDQFLVTVTIVDQAEENVKSET